MTPGYCARHPTVRLLPKQDICTFCEDWHTGAIFVGRDKLMDFVTQGIHPKMPAGIHVRSMRQWERLCTRHGVTADLSLQERIQRKRVGVAARAKQERRRQLLQKARPIVERAYHQPSRQQVAAT